MVSLLVRLLLSEALLTAFLGERIFLWKMQDSNQLVVTPQHIIMQSISSLVQKRITTHSCESIQAITDGADKINVTL